MFCKLITKKSIFDVFESIMKHFHLGNVEFHMIDSIEMVCNSHDLGTEGHITITINRKSENLILEDIVEFNRKFPWVKEKFYLKVSKKDSTFLIDDKVKVENVENFWRSFINFKNTKGKKK